MTKIGRQSSKGFSLTEALVASAIAAITVSQFYNSLALGNRLHARTELQDELTAASLAILDMIDAAPEALAAGQSWEGEETSYRWSAHTTDASTALDIGWLRSGQLVTVEVTVAPIDESDEGQTLRVQRLAGRVSR